METVLGLTSWPCARKASASLAGLFDTHFKGRSGSPIVAGSNEGRIAIGHGLPTAAFTPHATLRQDRSLQFIKTTPDRRASDPRDLMHRDDPTTTRRPRLDGREMPPATLVKLRAKQPPSLPNRFAVDHDRAIPRNARLVNRPRPSHYDAAQSQTDSLIVGSVLTSVT